MIKYQTNYKKVAEGIITQHPMRYLTWYDKKLFWKTRQGWLELVVGVSSSWHKVESEERIKILNKEILKCQNPKK